MAAPILWASEISWFFLLENPHAHRIPRFNGGGAGFRGGGGGSANFIFVGMGIFLIIGMLHSTFQTNTEHAKRDI